MRKTLLILFALISLSVNAQIVNKFRDSTWFAKGVQFDSTLNFKGLKTGGVADTFVVVAKSTGTVSKIPKSTFLSGVSSGGVTSVATNTGSGITGGTITSTGTLVIDTTIVSTKNYVNAKFAQTTNGTVTSVATGIGLSGGTITTSGTLVVDTNVISTKANVTGLLLSKQDNLISGTNIKTINSNSLLGSGNIVTPDAQTLSVGTNTLTISGGNTVDLNRKVDTSYQIKNTARDSTCQITIINGLTYRSCTKDTVSTLTPTSTTTFTNKRITARVDSTTSSATPTINTDNVDTYKLTAQAADITSFTTNLSGTPTDDQILHIIVTATGSHTVTFGSKFEASTVALPTTISTTRSDWYFVWNTATSKWRIGGVW